MEARMLSLFDDEDFLPQEKPKPVKPKKLLAKKEDVKPETGEDNQDKELPEPAAAANEVPPAAVTESPVAQQEPVVVQEEQEPVIVQEEQEPIVVQEEQEPVVVQEEQEPVVVQEEQEPVVAQEEQATGSEAIEEEVYQPATAATAEPDKGDGAGNATLAEQEQPAATTEDAPPDNTQPEDDELNKQILSEIMLSDYSAFIHKEYPFDLKTVEVVKKDKEIKVPLPQVAPAVEAVTIEEEEEEDADDEPAAPLPEWNLDKRYYTIGEVSQLFKVNTSHIRFWTNEFKLRPRTTRKGDRLYSPEDIARLRLIHHLVKEKKHTIKGAKEKLKAEKGAVGSKLDLKESLISLKEMLVQIKEQL